VPPRPKAEKARPVDTGCLVVVETGRANVDDGERTRVTHWCLPSATRETDPRGQGRGSSFDTGHQEHTAGGGCEPRTASTPRTITIGSRPCCRIRGTPTAPAV